MCFSTSSRKCISKRTINYVSCSCTLKVGFVHTEYSSNENNADWIFHCWHAFEALSKFSHILSANSIQYALATIRYELLLQYWLIFAHSLRIYLLGLLLYQLNFWHFKHIICNYVIASSMNYINLWIRSFFAKNKAYEKVISHRLEMSLYMRAFVSFACLPICYHWLGQIWMTVDFTENWYTFFHQFGNRLFISDCNICIISIANHFWLQEKWSKSLLIV